MANTQLPPDFKDFLSLLNENRVKYLLIGGYAVGYHGYPRNTADMDVWIGVDSDTAEKMVKVMVGFGFEENTVTPDVFLNRDGVIRMGVPPLRLEILMQISGVDFDSCYERRVNAAIDGVKVSIISLQDLRENKRASGRFKDLSDLEHLPPSS
jgi:predicted nucleotidyltransferase